MNEFTIELSELEAALVEMSARANGMKSNEFLEWVIKARLAEVVSVFAGRIPDCQE